MEMLAFDIAAFWSLWLRPILLLVIGLGLVIFVHELGHFLLAKAVGIKVERFALGFGPRLLGVRIGETDYCLRLLPLGGYVKMLGQEDFKPQQEQADPRAFCSKTPGARTAVVCAGVVMNVLFAAMLFIVVCLVGIRFPAPVVGMALEGFPAAEANIVWLDAPPGAGARTPSRGLQPGDRILRVDGDKFFLKLIDRQVTRFSKLALIAALAGKGDRFRMMIDRDVDGRTWHGMAMVGVRAQETDSGGERYQFGMVPAAEPVFGEPEGYLTAAPFRDGDRIVAIDGRPVRQAWDIPPIEKSLTGQPVRVTVQRDGRPTELTVRPALAGGKPEDVLFLKDGQRLYGRLSAPPPGSAHEKEDRVLLELPDGQVKTLRQDEIAGAGKAEYLDILGMTPPLLVDVVEIRSPAHKAGILPGDVVVSYGDRPHPTLRAFLDVNDASAGAGTNMVVRRGGEVLPPIWIEPKKHRGRVLVGTGASADTSSTVVAGVRAGSPAEKAGIRGGDLVEQVNGRPTADWSDVFNALKDSQDQPVVLTLRRGSQVVPVDIGLLTASQFDPRDYSLSLSLGLRPMMGPKVQKHPVAAIGWGLQETWEFLVATYASLHSFLQGNISGGEFRGVLGIGQLGIQVGRKSFIDLVYFMAMISVSLAVVNFLPIPVTDGGHVVFLLLEKIRGRPVSLKIVNAAQIAGLVVIAGIFLAVTWNDLVRILSGMW